MMLRLICVYLYLLGHLLTVLCWIDHVDDIVIAEEKSSTLNATTQMCISRWRGLVRYNGRSSTERDDLSDFFPVNVSVSNKQKILLVHVGKTGGSAVATQLRKMKIIFQQIHMHAVDIEMLEMFDVILITLRHPLDRLISAYHYTHPHVREQLALPSLSHIHQHFYECSPTLKDFARNLFESTHCGNLTQKYHAQYHRMHIYSGACAYLGGVSRALFSERLGHVYVINMESMKDDLCYIIDKLKWKSSCEQGMEIANVNVNVPKPTSIVYKNGQTVLQSMSPQESTLSLMQLSGYLSISGEFSLYNQLQSRFSRSLLLV